MIIAVDFDGVLCEKKWPEIGRPNAKLMEHLAKLREEGHKVILWTNRTDVPFTDREGNVRFLLKEAVDFCRDNGLVFDYVNESDPEPIHKFGSDPRKIFANVYMDDNNATTAFMEKYHIPFNANTAEMEDIL